MAKVALYGGNSIRTWNTNEAGRILDEAASYGLTVTLGLEVGNEWWGNDFSYWNSRAVDEKIAALKKVVEQYKDHPALLMWGIGNEVHLFGGNQLMVLHTIDRIAKMIHETDPNHPVMTAVPLGPNFSKRGLMRLLCPNLDILGVNGFARLPYLQEEIGGLFGWNKAYILSEWGSEGPWEANSTDWGAPLEKSSTLRGQEVDYYWDVINKDSTYFLGGYAFYWGTKYERTETFYSLFSFEDFETESVNRLRVRWSGVNPDNWAPSLDSLHMNGEPLHRSLYLPAGSVQEVQAFAHDPDNDLLSYCWEIRPEGFDDMKKGNYDYVLNHLLPEDGGSNIQFCTPEQEGGYRLYVYVYDGNQHITTHNIPFYTLIP
ncbi:cellulase family glycosylhydrolase [Cesiribacter sp. SM1]|uniref:cellulase family glycosylhydrolase n=1 Tax=Cesiribacter sp. SM1 TaxID=2861196 RepID=UPI001CD6C783|nr:cellulase family glycosylhydrolase [Cesiribacter sp. SM1]